MNDWQRAMLASAPKVDLNGRDINRCTPLDPVLIPRNEDHSDRHNAPHPSWERVYRRGDATKGEPEQIWLKPLVRCICGALTGIGLHHVHADGHVTASFYHATPEQLGPDGVKRFGSDGCGWHVFIALADYGEYGEYPSERDERAPAPQSAQVVAAVVGRRGAEG